ncbi:MAG: PqqD family protein [Candidatus Acidiferrum sp.]
MAISLSELPRSGQASANSEPVHHVRSSAIVSRDVAGETIVVPICRGVGDLDSVFTFNPVGRGLWRLLESGHSLEELADWVAINYEVDANQALIDVRGYLADLQEAGLIRTV